METAAKIEKHIVNLEPIDISYTDKKVSKYKKTHWNFDKYGIAIGLNIHVKTKISFCPIMVPQKRLKSIKFVYFFVNKNEELFTSRVYLRDCYGTLKILPIISSNRKLGVVEFDLPIENVNANVPLCFSSYIAPTKPIFIKNFWLEFEVEDNI
jgi:hypothetical protein